MHRIRRTSALAALGVLALLLTSACTSPTGPDGAVLSQEVKVDVQNDRDWRINIFAERNLLPVWQATVHAGRDTLLDFPLETAEAGPLRFVFFPQDPEPVPGLWSDTLQLVAGDVVEIVAAANIRNSSITVRSR